MQQRAPNAWAIDGPQSERAARMSGSFIINFFFCLVAGAVFGHKRRLLVRHRLPNQRLPKPGRRGRHT